LGERRPRAAEAGDSRRRSHRTIITAVDRRHCVAHRDIDTWGRRRSGGTSPGHLRGDLVPDWAKRLQTAMRGATFLSISPTAMREWAPMQAPEMGADGENVSAVVHRMCQDRNEKRRLVDWISELCAPRIRDISFARSELGEVVLQLVEEDGSKISARSLSDGTLRFLGEL